MSKVETPIQKIKEKLKESEGKVIIGKHIPIHWGRRRILNWQIVDSFSCAIIGMDSFKTKKEAIDEYFKNRDYYDKLITRGKVVICPQIMHSGAIMSPYSIGWSQCIDPITQENAGLR